jgi:hypothetical protein
MSAKEIGERLRKLPGVFVRFAGAQARSTSGPVLDARFTLFAVTGQGAAEELRRRGSKVTIGAYSLVQMLITALSGRRLPEPAYSIPAAFTTDAGATADGGVTADTVESSGPWPIPGLIVGCPYFDDVSAFWSEDVDAMGLTIYGVQFKLQFNLPPIEDVTDFLAFDGQIGTAGQVLEVRDGGGSLPLQSGSALAEIRVSLPPADE